jgi:predicted MFS family arabinose efflux permease
MTALRGRDYRNLLAAGLISETGDWLLLVALPILVYELTGSVLGTAIAFLVELVPPILLGTFAGRLADRWNRRRALIWLSLAQAATLLPLLAAGGRLWVVYAVITVQAGLATFTEPTRNALVPAVTPREHLVGANALLSLSGNVGRLVGGSLGGFLLVVADLPAIVAVDAVSFGLAAMLYARIRTGRPASGPASSAASGPASSAAADPTPVDGDTSSHAYDHRRVRAGLIVAGLGAAAQGMFVVLFVPFVYRALQGGADQAGLLRGVQAIGAIAAGLALGLLARRCRPGMLAAAGFGAFGVLSLIIWNGSLFTNAEPLYVGLFVAVGAPGVVAVTGLFSMLQEAGHDRVGRVFGAVTTVFAAGQAIGMIAAGLLGDRLPLVVLLNIQAGLYLVAAAVAVTWVGPMKGRPPSGETGVANESGSGGFEPNPLGDSGGMQSPSVNPGNTAKM